MQFEGGSKGKASKGCSSKEVKSKAKSSKGWNLKEFQNCSSKFGLSKVASRRVGSYKVQFGRLLQFEGLMVKSKSLKVWWAKNEFDDLKVESCRSKV